MRARSGQRWWWAVVVVGVVAAFLLIAGWQLQMHPDEELSYRSTNGDLAFTLDFQMSVRDNQAPLWFVTFWAWRQTVGAILWGAQRDAPDEVGPLHAKLARASIGHHDDGKVFPRRFRARHPHCYVLNVLRCVILGAPLTVLPIDDEVDASSSRAGPDAITPGGNPGPGH